MFVCYVYFIKIFFNIYICKNEYFFLFLKTIKYNWKNDFVV